MKTFLARGLVFATTICAPHFACAQTTPSLTSLTPAQAAQQMIAVNAFDRYDFATALPIFIKLAALGDARAEADLGVMYARGLGVPQDKAQGLMLLQLAVGQGYTKAEVDLGELAGDAGKQHQAFDWFTMAAEQGDPYGEIDLARMYDQGVGVQQDHSQSFYWLNQAASTGNPMAERYLGTAYYQGDGVQRDYAKALQIYILSAQGGDSRAAGNVGEMYEAGEGAKQNYATALHWDEISAREGCSCGFDNLGHLYAEGIGVPKNAAVAFRWFLIAAQKGDVRAESNIGMMYHTGRGVGHDDVQASYWYSLAAAQGDPDAELNLGILYKEGWGIAQDPEKAVALFKLAVAQGKIDAEDQLGRAYYEGSGVTQDYEKAANYFALAADKADPDAQVFLGYMNETGQGMTKDYAADYKWAVITEAIMSEPLPDSITFDQAQDENRADAHMAIDVGYLTRAQVASAQAAAKAWLNTHGFNGAEIAKLSLPEPARPKWQIFSAAIVAIIAAYVAAKLTQASLRNRRMG